MTAKTWFLKSPVDILSPYRLPDVGDAFLCDKPIVTNVMYTASTKVRK